MGRLSEVLLLAVTAVGGACGRGDGAPTPASATSREEIDAPATPEIPVRIPFFSVWHVPGAPPDFEAIREMLAAGDGRVEAASSYEEWLESGADVLLLRGTDETGLPMEDEFLEGRELESLKGRRVLGIGGEAGRVFGALGLEVNGGHTATFERARPSLTLQKTVLLPAEVAGTAMTAFDAAVLPGGPRRWECEALFLPRVRAQAGPVEAIARWSGDRDYAPLAREQNYVLCGVTADVRTWTSEFRRTVRDLAHALATRPPEPFALAEWEVTAPGTYPIELKRALFGGSEIRRVFFFRFERPGLFEAHLQIERGGQGMLHLSRDRGHGDDDRVDGEAGETLRIVMPVRGSSIRANGGRYWRLSVTNVGMGSMTATLRVNYQEGATLRFPDGTAVPTDPPPTDLLTVERVIGFLDHADPEVGKRAEAALIVIGRPALAALEAAEERLRWPADRERILQLSMISQRIQDDR